MQWILFSELLLYVWIPQTASTYLWLLAIHFWYVWECGGKQSFLKLLTIHILLCSKIVFYHLHTKFNKIFFFAIQLITAKLLDLEFQNSRKKKQWSEQETHKYILNGEGCMYVIVEATGLCMKMRMRILFRQPAVIHSSKP